MGRVQTPREPQHHHTLSDADGNLHLHGGPFSITIRCQAAVCSGPWTGSGWPRFHVDSGVVELVMWLTASDAGSCQLLCKFTTSRNEIDLTSNVWKLRLKVNKLNGPTFYGFSKDFWRSGFYLPLKNDLSARNVRIPMSSLELSFFFLQSSRLPYVFMLYLFLTVPWHEIVLLYLCNTLTYTWTELKKLSSYVRSPFDHFSFKFHKWRFSVWVCGVHAEIIIVL